MLGTRRTKQLQPRVTAAANYLAVKLGMDGDEAEQEIWLGICERAHQDKSFLKQTDAYVVQGGVFYARNHWQKRQTRERRCVAEEAARQIPTDARLLDNLSSREFLEGLLHRLRGDRVAKETAKGLLVGFQKQEIAARARVSPQAVSAAVKRLEAAAIAMGGI